MLIIQASNIHTGGGATLLNSLLRGCDALKLEVLVFHDERFRSENFGSHIKMKSVPANLIARLITEWKIFKQAKTNDTILFFGNLPPLFPVKGSCILFFQNLLLLKPTRLDFALRVIIQQVLEKMWLRLTIQNVQRVVVQSISVSTIFNGVFPKKSILVLPFAGFAEEFSDTAKIYDFAYISSGDPHKNHLNLLEAWQHLADLGIFPTLILTVSASYDKILNKITDLQKKGLKITNENSLTHKEVLAVYRKSKCLIFPSFAESFGLPLIEAKNAKIPIIASELDYVRDVVEPVQTFDPHSSRSIARAVIRFLNLQSDPVQAVHTPNEFLKEILKS